MSYPTIKVAGEQVTADDFNDFSLNPTYTYGETITAGQALYLKASDSKVYKAAATSLTHIGAFVGVALISGVANDVNRILAPGKVVTGLSGLTAGAPVYLSDTAGTISSTAGTYAFVIGVAKSTTSILINTDRTNGKIFHVFGDASDGDFSASSGTTTWNTSGKEIYQFGNFDLTGTAKLTLGSNLQGKRIIVYVDGNLTLTSSDAKAIDLDGLGGTNGTASVQNAGTDGGNGNYLNTVAASFGGGGGVRSGSPTQTGGGGGGGGGASTAGNAGTAGSGGGGSGGAAGAAGGTNLLPIVAANKDYISPQWLFAGLGCGGGGGGGGGVVGSGAFAVPGAGGKGGGCMIFIVRGNINVTCKLSALGANGSAATNEGPNYYAGGGGGGGGGSFGIFYAGSVTANTPTFYNTGGTGGSGGAPGGNGGNGIGVVRKINIAFTTAPMFV